MSKELSKIYKPSKYEDGIYKAWEKSGFFNPDNLLLENIKKDKDGKELVYTIVLPPPNITDKLHLGHSAMLAIEDLLIRYHRMKGYRTLWIPGTDHAAIATQNVVEKKLLKEEGLIRHDLGREKFLKKISEFVKITQSTILNQTRKMGASLDWSREAFTLDKQREKAVQKMFVNMFKEEVIYRGERIVNWCPRCHSTLADDEVEYKEQKTILYTFKYSKDFPFTIATTRPETKLGDTAVAVNPKDKRYKKYIGKVYKVDFCGLKLKLKIIADRHVEMDFGTGALGVTPAHSMADWQMAKENNLKIVKVISEDGRIKNNFGKYSGKLVKEAQEMIVEKLRKNNLLEKEEEMKNNLSICYRCGTAIEPLPSKQWFINVNKKLKRLDSKSLKEKAIEVAKDKSINFIPERFEKRYLNWMENLHDWCISRQIWFGHQIPVWRKKINLTKDNWHEIYDWGIDDILSGNLKDTHIRIFNIKNGKRINNPKELMPVVPDAEGEYDFYVCTFDLKYIKELEKFDFKQDSDSLDTWFSSGMWTFSTLGWLDNFKDGEKTGDLVKFHPTQVLETGYDILTLWVSRMIMMSLFALEEIPFSDVYLHGMVLDKYGKKMSKSKGNGIDPIDMIKKYGTDAVRLSLLIGSTAGNDVRISEEKIAGYRNFTNKLWNISRYILQNQKSKIKNKEINYKNCSIVDLWILSKMENLIKEVSDDLNSYQFSRAGERLKDFTWNDFADWYIEVSKFEKNLEKNKILIIILQNLLKLWHPFMPFVTEKIWEKLGNDKFLMIEEWPLYAKNIINKKVSEFELIKKIIIAIRNARAQYKIQSNQKIKIIIYANKYIELLNSQEILIKNLRTGIKNIEIKNKGEKIEKAINIIVSGIEIYLIGAVDKIKENKNIEKEIINLKNIIINAEKKLSNKQFIKLAPKQIVRNEKEKLILWKNKLKKLNNFCIQNK